MTLNKLLISIMKKFRDAQIVLDNIDEISSNLIDINITIEEGIKYHFRNIDWLGNKIQFEYLDLLLGIKSGDVYDEKMMNERLQMSMSGTDITSYIWMMGIYSLILTL